MPSPTHTVRIQNHRIAYDQCGAGPPVVLLHGIPTSRLLWRNVAPALAETHLVIAPDMLNYGQSERPESANVSIEAQSRVIVALMDHLGLESADIVAHDIGGGVAQLIAVNHPARVRRLVLMDAVCFDSWPIPEFLPLQAPGAEERISLEEVVTMLREFMPRGVHNRDVMTDDVVEMYIAPWSSEEGKRALFRNLRRLNPEYTLAIAGDLKRLVAETLIIWGEEDVFQKPAYARRLQKTIPNAKLIMIKDAGHWLMEDKPQEVNRHLAAFLDGN